MGRPFKLKEQQAAIGRASDGKFVRIEDPNPGSVAEEAKREGKKVDEVVAQRRAPDRPVGSDEPESVEDDERNAVYADSLPWPEAGPVNDADAKPMKLLD